MSKKFGALLASCEHLVVQTVLLYKAASLSGVLYSSLHESGVGQYASIAISLASRRFGLVRRSCPNVHPLHSAGFNRVTTMLVGPS